MVSHRAVVALRICLVGLFALLVVFQTMSLPGQFAHMARESPEDAGLRWPATAITVFWVLCVQVVVVATWRLLSMVEQDRIFTSASFRWVDAILAAMAAGWLVLVAVFLYVGLRADDPGLPMLLLLLLAVLTVVALLMVVMRALLHRATELRADVEATI